MTIEYALELAKKRVLPPGYKPEDYLMVNDKVPFTIAAMIVKEALHILKMHKLYGKL